MQLRPQHPPHLRPQHPPRHLQVSLSHPLTVHETCVESLPPTTRLLDLCLQQEIANNSPNLSLWWLWISDLIMDWIIKLFLNGEMGCHSRCYIRFSIFNSNKIDQNCTLLIVVINAESSWHAVDNIRRGTWYTVGTCPNGLQSIIPVGACVNTNLLGILYTCTELNGLCCCARKFCSSSSQELWVLRFYLFFYNMVHQLNLWKMDWGS